MKKSRQPKHLIIASIFEFGGSNTHLKTLFRYFGPENIILILANSDQVQLLNNITDTSKLRVIIKPSLHLYAHLRYRFTTNIKEFLRIAKSIIEIKILTLKLRCKTITICAVDPEKYLYLLWTPMVKVFYILHTTPGERLTPFTTLTCNVRLGKKKRIITVSHANKKLVCDNWVLMLDKAKFIDVVYNCPSSEENYTLAPNPGKECEKFIVTMGHVTAYKNPLLWLEVARLVDAQFSGVRFVWLGDGPLLKELKFNSRNDTYVNFTGFIAAPHHYLSMATIYYQPSLEETHGIGVVEAMSASLPCVTSNRGGLPESVTDGDNGYLLEPTDAKGQARAILKLLNDPALCHEFGMNSYKKYKDFFTFPAFKKSMDYIYGDNT